MECLCFHMFSQNVCKVLHLVPLSEIFWWIIRLKVPAEVHVKPLVKPFPGQANAHRSDYVYEIVPLRCGESGVRDKQLPQKGRAAWHHLCHPCLDEALQPNGRVLLQKVMT